MTVVKNCMLILLSCMILQLLGCHHVPPYHEPAGYSSTYVKALKTGPQGHATPLRSTISRVKPMRQRICKDELLEQNEEQSANSELTKQSCPELPPAIFPELPMNQANETGAIN